MAIKVLNEFLPHAEEVRLGAIKVGETLDIDSSGTLNLKDLADVANKLTNCVIEVPQNINVEASGLDVVLKKDSILTLADGSQYITTTNITRHISNGNKVVVIGLANKTTLEFVQLFDLPLSKICSGESDALAGTPQHLWFDTTETTLKYYGADGVTNNYYAYLPICVVSVENETACINQVFNGAGYIGKYAFILPGIRALISDGFLEDGTYKNLNYLKTNLVFHELAVSTTSPLRTLNLYTPSSTGVWSGRYVGEVESLYTLPNNNYQYYVRSINKVVTANTQEQYTGTVFIRYGFDGQNVTSFEIRSPIKLATTDDISNIYVKTTNTTALRPLNDRFGDYINVKDFGAIGDGVTDDTAAIQAAINSAHLASTGIQDIIFFPAGSYKVNTITISDGQSVILSHPTLVSESTALEITNTYPGTVIEYGNITAKDSGIWIKSGNAIHIEHTQITITHDYTNSDDVFGIKIGGAQNLTPGSENIISDCTINSVHYVNSYGLYNVADNCQINNLTINNFKYGIRDDGMSNAYCQINCQTLGYTEGTAQEKTTSLTNSIGIYCYKDITIQSLHTNGFQRSIYCGDTSGLYQHKIDGFFISHDENWPSTLDIYAVYGGTTYYPDSILISNLDMNNGSSATQYFTNATSGYNYDPKFYYNNPVNIGVEHMPIYTDSLIQDVGTGTENEARVYAVQNDNPVSWLGFYKYNNTASGMRSVIAQNTNYAQTSIALEQSASGGNLYTPNILPHTTNTYTLGSESAIWQSIYSASPASGDLNNQVITTEWADRFKTNCVTEIPQDIKLELSSTGTLTLKKGSKITLPDGTQLITTVDRTTTNETNGQHYIFPNATGTSIGNRPLISIVGSGTTLPADGSTYQRFFNISDLTIYTWNTTNHTWENANFALPICIVTVSDGKISNIDTVFNGAGFIGHHAFVLPGVKCLISDGKNNDGTLKNIALTKTGLTFVELATWQTAVRAVFIKSDNTCFQQLWDSDKETVADLRTDNWYVQYVKSENYNYQYRENILYTSPSLRFVQVKTNDFAQVVDFKIKQPIRLASSDIVDNKVESNPTITGSTKCKITYDSKGLVTAGANLSASDIPAITLSKISDVTASAAELNTLDGVTASTSELNILDGITATTTELNYINGVTSNIQTQLDSKVEDVQVNSTSVVTNKVANIDLSNYAILNGSNTFTGSVNLGSQAIATTPAYSDNDTSVATTAMVHALDSSTKTDCIINVPQDINITLSTEGVLTVKSGTKVYLPNNTSYTINNDTTFTHTEAGKWFVCMSGQNIVVSPTPTYSGDTAPSDPTAGILWFDTVNIIIKRWNGSTWDSDISIPIARITVSNNIISSIDQIFNGISYVGKKVFALPGLKALIPYGRNADGTLKNIEQAISQVKYNGNDNDYRNGVFLYSGGTINRISTTTGYVYDEQTNFYIRQSDKNNVHTCLLATIIGNIDELIVNPAFRSANYYDVNRALNKKQDTVTGAASTVTTSDLAINTVVISNAQGKLDTNGITTDELYYLHNATSNIQTQLDNKVEKNNAITGATKCKITYDSKGLVTKGADLTASDIPNLSLSKITDITATAAEVNILDGITATTTELNYVDGVTSSIQGQIGTLSSLTTIDKANLVAAINELDSDIEANATAIDDINDLIPSAASSTNQLADKDFVNSSIATSTANFIGTFNSLADLEAYSGPVTNSDYAFVATTDALGNTSYSRYKYSTLTTPPSWVFEYELNNSSFTTSQWAAINSGATTTNIGQITTNQTAIGNLATLTTTAQTDLVSAINELDSDKLTANTAITGSTKCKITYDSKGLVTAGANLSASDIPNLSLSKITDVTATAAEVNVLDGITATTAELNYVDGVTSNIQTQLDNKVTKNNAITGATKCKITYDSKGLVTAGANLSASDIPNLSLSKITDVTATAAEVNVLDGITTSTTELNYTAGVTSPIQTQLNSKVDTTTYTAGMAEKQDLVTALNFDRISNCITKIPQDINLTLADGTLTLKSGSIVTYADGTQYQLTTDKTRSSGSNGDMFIVYRKDNVLIDMPVAQCFSGATQPTGVIYAIWYDTTNNIVKYTSNGFSTYTECSFPIAKVTFSNNIPVSINQVFNGCGYIGKNAFVLPGIEYLLADGFNTDGTLKSRRRKISELNILNSYSANDTRFIILQNNNTATTAGAGYEEVKALPENPIAYKVYYLVPENKIMEYYTDAWHQVQMTPFARLTTIFSSTISDYAITEIDIRQPIQVATVEQLETKLTKNSPITAATKCKITYDSNGLITNGENLTASDIPNLSLSKITDITATATEVNVLDGITASTAELNYVDGVTSNIQTQLDSKVNTSTYTAGMAEKQDLATALNFDRISNCVIKIPKNINLDLADDGTLTIKIGSKLYYPNGNEYELINDLTYTFTTTGTWLLTIEGTSTPVRCSTQTYSGSTAPSNPTTGTMWYDTTNNIIKRWNGSSWTSGHSFPIAIFTVVNGQITRINKVIEGVGYIGHHAYVLPDILCLVPYGLNTDGTLKSITTTSNLRIVELIAGDPSIGKTRAISNIGYWNSYCEVDTYADADFTIPWVRYYIKNENKIYTYNGTDIITISEAPLAFYYYNSTSDQVTTFDVRQPIRVATTEMLDNVIAEIAELGDDVVKLTGDQTINGEKTFTQAVQVTGNFTNADHAYTLTDTNNRGSVSTIGYSTNDTVRNRQSAYNSTANKEANLDITATDSGQGILYANGSVTGWVNNDASSSTSSTNVAFVGWVNDPTKSTNVVHRTGNETIAGTKTFSSEIDGTLYTTIPVDSTKSLVRAKVAGTDAVRLAAGGANNSGYVELATADDGKEPIYVRQYNDAFETIQRTATLLDGAGNTSFPGTVTAPIFSGTLKGDVDGGFVYYKCHNGETGQHYYKMGEIVLSGTHNTQQVQFMMQDGGINITKNGLNFGEISLRVNATAGILGTSTSGIFFNSACSPLALDNLDNIRLYYWNNYGENTNKVKVELWCYVQEAYDGRSFSIIDKIGAGNARSNTSWTFYDGDLSDNYPTDATGYIAAAILTGNTATPVSNSNDTTVANTSWINTKLTDYQTIANLETSLSTSNTKYPSSGAVKAAIDALPVDSSVVHKAGTETITGAKTFSNDITVDSKKIYIKNSEDTNASISNTYIEFQPLTSDTFGGFIDFHYAGASSDYTTRIIEDASGKLTYEGAENFTADTSTSSDTIATKGWVNLYKQDKLNSTQMNAVNSGATTTNIGQIATNTTDISTINTKIPSEATSTNKLADKQYVTNAIDSAISSVYKPAGSSTFTNRPTPAKTIEGNVYNITDAFTTDSTFVEGAGHNYPEGTNIVCINTSGTTYKWDVLAGFIDLSGYQLANTAVTHTESTSVGSATQPVYIASNGAATAVTYTLEKSVPSDAVFTDTTYDDYTGATSSTDGVHGLVPAATSANRNKFLRGDATWQTPTDTKNTAGGDDTSSKIFLVGMTAQTSSNGTSRTYTQDTAFVDADGRLNSAAPASDANDTTVATTKWVKDQNYVPTTRTVNNKALSSNITLTASDVGAAATVHTHTGPEITLTGYTKPASTSAIAATDNVNEAIGKLETAIDTLPVDSNVVHKTGDETVAGTKTFTSSPIVKRAQPNQFMQYSDVDKGIAPSETTYGWIGTITDKNGTAQANKLAQIYHSLSASGSSSLSMELFAPVAGSTVSDKIAIGHDGTNFYATAPAPSASDAYSSKHITTVGWVNDPTKSLNVVHRSGNETITGVKTFSSPICAEIKAGEGGFQYGYGHTGATGNKYYKIASLIVSGTFQTPQMQFMCQMGSGGNYGICFGEIQSRVDETAGTISKSKTKVMFSAIPQEILNALDDTSIRLYYWNNFETNKAKLELWVKITNTYTGMSFSALDTIANSEYRTTGWTFYQNQSADAFPTDATDYVNYVFSQLNTRTPTEDTTTSPQIDTVGARNTKLANYQTLANLDSSLSSSTTKYPSSKAVKDVTDTLAVDTNVVHKTGNETIAGEKTFTSNINANTSITVGSHAIMSYNITTEALEFNFT